MPTIEITNNNTVGVVVFGAVYALALVEDATGGTYPAGTLLARSSVTQNLTAYVAGGTNGTGTPLAVLTQDLVLGAATPASLNVLIAGQVRRGKLSRYNAGTPAELTQAEVDALRDYSIIAQSTTENTELDNQ